MNHTLRRIQREKKRREKTIGPVFKEDGQGSTWNEWKEATSCLEEAGSPSLVNQSVSQFGLMTTKSGEERGRRRAREGRERLG
jgi:hypothetical protein